MNDVREERVTMPDGIRFVVTDGTVTVDCPVVVTDMAHMRHWRSYWTAAVQRGLRDVQAGRLRNVIEVAPNHYRVFSY